MSADKKDVNLFQNEISEDSVVMLVRPFWLNVESLFCFFFFFLVISSVLRQQVSSFSFSLDTLMTHKSIPESALAMSHSYQILSLVVAAASRRFV